MKGPEGPRIFTGADEGLIKKEQRGGEIDVHEAIQLCKNPAKEALNNSQLVTLLQGEKFFEHIANLNTEEQKINLAMSIINQMPFVVKLFPARYTDDIERAIFMVALAEVVNEANEDLN